MYHLGKSGTTMGSVVVFLGILAAVLGACRPSGLSEPGIRRPDPGQTSDSISLLPAPQRVEGGDGTLTLPDTLSCSVADASLRPLVEVLDYEYHMRTGGRVVAAPPGKGALCRLDVDAALEEHSYRLTIDSTISLTGGSRRAVTWGSTTFMQALQTQDTKSEVPVLTITLSSGRPGTIHYTTDGTEPSPSDPAYDGPITVDRTAIVHAQLFSADGEPLGHPWIQHFKKVG